MDHGLDIERRVTGDLLRLAKELNLPLVATNDLHYTHEHDAKAHEALLAIQSGSTLLEPTYDNGGSRFAFSGSGYYLKSPQEMRELFRDHPEACDNTLLIAERCDVSFNTGANYMPRFPCPEGEDETSWLVKEVDKGLQYRYPKGIPDKVRAQADYELGVITSMGFPGYFLVVADFINWAKNNGIRVGPGRGSGAGSMVAYAMRITDLDPLHHGLIFERFLNPDRVSMPDFDVDFDDRRRSEVIDYVTRKYGDERVAMIVTYGTIKTKQALKDSSRVLGYPFSMGETLTKALPPAVMAKDIPLADIQNKDSKRYSEAGDFRQLIATDPEAAKVFETALGIEGLKRQWGVHAAGVIMSSDPIIDVIPIMRRFQDGQVITQFDYPTSEGLGLIRWTSSACGAAVVSDALENMKVNRGWTWAWSAWSSTTRQPTSCWPGRHAGHVPARQRPMRSLLKLMRPDNSKTSARCWPSTTPARWARTANRLRLAQEQDPGRHPDPPGAGGTARRNPVAPRPDRLPGAGHVRRAEARRLLAGTGRHPAPRHGQEEEIGTGQAVHRLLPGHARQRLLHGRSQDPLGRPASVLRLRLQQGPLGRLRRHLLLDRLPQGPLCARVHSRAARHRRGREDKSAIYLQTNPTGGHHGAAAGRRRVRTEFRAP